VPTSVTVTAMMMVVVMMVVVVMMPSHLMLVLQLSMLLSIIVGPVDGAFDPLDRADADAGAFDDADHDDADHDDSDTAHWREAVSKCCWGRKIPCQQLRMVL
jgi:hypothetical protein